MKASPQALAAVRAAKNYDRWGPDAATKYASNHGASLLLLLAMALGLEARLAGTRGR